jgi:diadenylate cyclase
MIDYLITKVTGIYQIVPHVFSSLTFKDTVDILIVALLIYLVLIFIKQSRSFFVFNSILFLLLIGYLSRSFDLALTRELFQPLFTFILVIFVVVFQKEIRKFFDWFSLGSRHLSLLKKISIYGEVSSSIVKAVDVMTKKKIGGIFVFQGEYPLDDLEENGFPLEGKVSVPLVLSIFDTSSPGHDGAMLIKDNVIKRFGLHLPLAEDFRRYSMYGTRHRAAAGITEHTDALAVVVSEERGEVSVAQGGKLTHIENVDELGKIIKNYLKEDIHENNPSFWHYFVFSNFLTKVFSFSIALVLWFFFVFQSGVITQEFYAPIEFRFVPKDHKVENVSPREVKIILSGRNSDFQNYQGRGLNIVVNLADTKMGQQRVKVTQDDVSFPSYFKIVDVVPKEVTVTIVGPQQPPVMVN